MAGRPSPAPAGVRREDAALLRGAGRFLADGTPPGTLTLAFLRADRAARRLLTVDGTAALAMPGVVAILRADDIVLARAPSVNPLAPPLDLPEFSPLARDRVLAVGQPVAAVVATCENAALDALDAMTLAYGEPVDFGSTAFARTWRTAAVDPAPPAARVGLSLAHPRVAAMPLEPRGALADWDGRRLTMRLPTQSPSRARDELAALFALDPGQVRVIAGDVGGAFGAKASLHPEDIVCAAAALRLGRTVRWTGSRAEDLLAGTHGRGGRIDAELTLDADGAPLALRARIVYPLGHWLPYSAMVPALNCGRILPGPYAIAATEIETSGVTCAGPAMGIYRGAGRPEACLAMERLMDLAAARCGRDPLDYRRAAVVRRFPHATPTGETIDSGDLPRLLDLLAERADYAAERRGADARRAAGEIVGLGLALYVEPAGKGWEAARATLLADGRLRIATGTPSQGQGRATSFAAIAARALGIDPGQIEIVYGDTDDAPDGIGALASRSTAIGGGAVLAVCAALDAARAEAGAADLAALARLRPGLSIERRFDSPDSAWASGACLARVAIDRDTGVPAVERLWWVEDSGTIVSPALADGQLTGGIAQGIGEALMERLVFDAGGQLLSGSLMDYALPRARDIPPVDVVHAPTASPTNPLGAKGVGETGTIGAPAAIANAVMDALRPFGISHLDPPYASEKLWRAIKSGAGS
jgi:carbon-monoxide dehydrogenase large subunit